MPGEFHDTQKQHAAIAVGHADPTHALPPHRIADANPRTGTTERKTQMATLGTETFGNDLVRSFLSDELVHSALPGAPVRPDPPRRRTLRRIWHR